MAGEESPGAGEAGGSWEAAFGVEPAPHAAPADRGSLRAEAAEVGAELLQGLNPEQARAVQHGGGPLLILAGAGSGKTRVITRRIAWLVRVAGFDPRGVLAITFTNKAAAEMRSRVERLDVPAGAWISTFHSACARILRRDIGLLPPFTRDFTIYDTEDKQRLLRELIKDAGFDATRYRPAQLGAWISQLKNGPAEARAALADGSVEGEVLAAVLAAYERALAKNDALDFDDLLLKVLELFEREPGTRDAYARRFEHVLVDEYQDTNRVQYRLMCHLAGFHGNLTVCGDPDQSIYAWRGADVRNILDFESDFPGAAVVRLEQNYRSTRNILRAAQALIGHNRERKEKDLWSAGPQGELVEVIECADEDDEAVEIAGRIRGMLARGRRADEVAIFYRVNFMQRALERALRLSGVPYRVVAGVEFFQRREIKDLIAYLRLLVNPRDDEAFLRAVCSPARGVGEKSLEQLAGWAGERGLSLLAASGAEGLETVVRGRARAALAAFGRLIAELAPLREGPAELALRALLAAVDYEEWLAREQDDVDRQANVDELVANAETYDRLEPAGGLRGFLQDVALVSDADAYEQDAARVSLMTLHTAKGLEFPVVFIAGLEEELLPHARAIEEAFGGSDAGVEEERRLCYVGMTRAKELLFLTHARVRRHFGAEQYCRPSRFLGELPPELVAGTERTEDEAEEALGAYVPTGSAELDLREGDLVLHAHFGRGRIQALLGAGINARATVQFEAHGRKQLLLQYARLQVLERGGA